MSPYCYSHSATWRHALWIEKQTIATGWRQISRNLREVEELILGTTEHKSILWQGEGFERGKFGLQIQHPNHALSHATFSVVSYLCARIQSCATINGCKSGSLAISAYSFLILWISVSVSPRPKRVGFGWSPEEYYLTSSTDCAFSGHPLLKIVFIIFFQCILRRQ